MRLVEGAKHLGRILFAILVLACVGLLANRLMDTGEQVSEEMAWHGMTGSRDVRIDAGVERPPERYIADVASTTEGPIFLLERGLATLRVISFLHLDPSQSDGPEHYDPQRRYSYGLELVVRDEDRAVMHRQKVWFETRKSKLYQDNGVILDTSSAYLQAGEAGSGEPADQRMMDVDLEPFAGPGHSVEILAVSPDQSEIQHEVNLVLFARQPRSWDKVAWKMRTIEEEELAVISSRAGLLPWTRMTREEIEEALRYTFLRQTSFREVKMRQLLSTDYRRQIWTEPGDGELLGWAKPMVFNLRGPARLFAKPSRSSSVNSSPLHVEHLVMGGAQGPRWEVSDREAGAAAAPSLIAELGEGEVGSVAVWLDRDAAPERHEFFVNRGRAALGEHPLVKANNEEYGTRIWPDRKKIRLWPLFEQPTRYTLRQEELSLGDGILVTLRRRPGDAPRSIRYHFPDVHVEGIIKLPATMPLARTERLIPARTEASTHEADAADAMVSEPETFRIWLPPGATTMTLEALDATPGSQEIFASVSMLEINSDRHVQHRAPYDSQVAEEEVESGQRSSLRWRYAPLVEAPWFTIAPHDAADRIAQNHYAYLEAQVRLNWSGETLDTLLPGARGEGDAPLEKTSFASGLSESVLDASVSFSLADTSTTPRRFEPIEPRGVTRSRTRLIMERQPGVELQSKEGAATLLARWDEFDRVGFPPFHPWRCALPEEWKRGERLEVQYTAPEAGSEVTLSFAGLPRQRQIMRTRSARELFWTHSWPEKRGELLLSLLNAEKERVEQLAWTNCIPLEPDDRLSLWRVRRFHELSARRDLILDVDMDEEDTQGWYMHLSGYLEDASGAEIEVTIDDGEPARRQGVVSQFTLASRVITLQPHGRAPLAEAVNLSLNGPVDAVIPVGGDLAPGRHTIRVRWVGGGAGGWLRFYRFQDR